MDDHHDQAAAADIPDDFVFHGDHMLIRVDNRGGVELVMGPLSIQMTWVDAAVHAADVAVAAVAAGLAVDADPDVVEATFTRAFHAAKKGRS